MFSELEKEMERVQEQPQRLGSDCHAGAGEDTVDVQGCYRLAEALWRELEVSPLQRCATE